MTWISHMFFWVTWSHRFSCDILHDGIMDKQTKSVTLTEDQRSALQAICRRRKVDALVWKRARAFLLLDAGYKPKHIFEILDIGSAFWTNWRFAYADISLSVLVEGLQPALGWLVFGARTGHTSALHRIFRSKRWLSLRLHSRWAFPKLQLCWSRQADASLRLRLSEASEFASTGRWRQACSLYRQVRESDDKAGSRWNDFLLRFCTPRAPKPPGWWLVPQDPQNRH